MNIKNIILTAPWIIISFLIGVLFLQDKIYDTKLKTSEKRIADIRNYTEVLEDKYDLIKVTPREIPLDSLIKSISDTLAPKIKYIKETIVDITLQDSLIKRLKDFEILVKQYEDSLDILVEYADSTIRVDVPCDLYIQYYGTPFGYFLFDQYSRKVETTVIDNYIYPNTSYNIGAVVGFNYNGDFIYGIDGETYYKSIGFGVTITNKASFVKIKLKKDIFNGN